MLHLPQWFAHCASALHDHNMVPKRKAAEAFLEETKSSIDSAHGPTSLATLLSITEAVGADPLGTGKPLLPINVTIDKPGGLEAQRLVRQVHVVVLNTPTTSAAAVATH